jgi:hypothetical protein
MGFLKELFEKKLRSAGGQLEDEGLAVGISRSAHSEWALPALRPAPAVTAPAGSSLTIAAAPE